jgi:hypothetical protein
MRVSTSFAGTDPFVFEMATSASTATAFTNAFSKKADNAALSVASHDMIYNCCRSQRTLRVTPGMAAGATDPL